MPLQPAASFAREAFNYSETKQPNGATRLDHCVSLARQHERALLNCADRLDAIADHLVGSEGRATPTALPESPPTAGMLPQLAAIQADVERLLTRLSGTLKEIEDAVVTGGMPGHP